MAEKISKMQKAKMVVLSRKCVNHDNLTILSKTRIYNLLLGWKIDWIPNLKDIINDIKTEKKIFIKKNRKIIDQNQRNEEIFQFIEDSFRKFGYNIKLNALYYNLKYWNMYEFIDIFSKWLKLWDLNEEKRILRNKIGWIESNYDTAWKMYLPIYDKFISNKEKWYFTMDLLDNNVEDVYFVWNIIFNLIDDVIYHMFLSYDEQFMKKVIIDKTSWAFTREYGLNKLTKWILSLSEGKDLYVTFIDIDHFKNFNDKYWHPEWDNVLNIFVKAIIKSIRSTDYVFRYGWEEFILVIKWDEWNCKTIFTHFKEKVDNILQEKFSKKEIKELIKFSWWVSKSSSFNIVDINTKVESIITLADNKMYKSKENGRDKITLEDWSVIRRW